MLDKSQPASQAHVQAAIRWLDMTVALTMAYQSMPLDREARRKILEEMLGRWRGNRGDDWHPTPHDIDQLMESTTLWLTDRIRVNWLTPDPKDGWKNANDRDASA